MRPAIPRRRRPGRHRLHPPGAQPLHEPVAWPRTSSSPTSRRRRRPAADRPRAGEAKAPGVPGAGRPGHLARHARRATHARRAPARRGRQGAQRRGRASSSSTSRRPSLTARETERLFDIIGRLRADGTHDHLHLAHPARRHAPVATRSPCCATARWSPRGRASRFTIHTHDRARWSGATSSSSTRTAARAPAAEVSLEVRRLSQAGIAPGHRPAAPPRRDAGRLRPHGLGPHRAGADHLRPRRFDAGEVARQRAACAAAVAAALHPATSMAFVTENRREEGLMMTATVADNLGLAALPEYSTRPVGAVERGAAREGRARVSRDACASRSGDALPQRGQGPVRAEPAEGRAGQMAHDAGPPSSSWTSPRAAWTWAPSTRSTRSSTGIAAEGTACSSSRRRSRSSSACATASWSWATARSLGTFDRAAFDAEAILRTAFREDAA